MEHRGLFVKLKKWMAGLCMLGLSLPTAARPLMTSYVGGDLKWNSMPFKEAAGGNILQRNYPQGNLFGGIKFDELLAIELGYETTTRRNRAVVVPIDENFVGQFNDLLPIDSKTRTKISGYHANIVGFYPVCFEDYRLTLFGSLGLAQLKLKSKLDFSFQGDTEVLSRVFSKKTVLPRVTFGIQHMLNKHLGVRAVLAWEQLSSFKKIYGKTMEGEGTTLYIKPKDSKSIGFGVFYSF